MPASHPDSKDLREVYDLFKAAYGADMWHWSPEHVPAPIDVLVGAILVQHTTWASAERALEAMRSARVLDADAIARMPPDQLASLIRVSGTPAVKSRRLRALAETIARHGGLTTFLALPTDALRAELLATHGIGPETADAILLYAAHRRVFEIDAYTRRIFRRLGLGPEADSYDAWQRYFEEALGRDADVAQFQRYHAYIVLHGKRVCRPVPRCAACTLAHRCDEGIRRLRSALPRALA